MGEEEPKEEVIVAPKHQIDHYKMGLTLKVFRVVQDALCLSVT